MSAHDSTWRRFRAEVSASRRRIGEQVLVGLVLMLLSSALSAWIVATKAKNDTATEIAVLKMQIRDLRAAQQDMRRDLYAPRTPP